MGRRGRNPESVCPGEDARPAGCRPFCLPDMTPEREQRISSVTARRQRDLQVVIENVDDPHNLGAILRSCDAVGVGTVHLLYHGEHTPPNMRDLKTKAAASAAEWVGVKKRGGGGISTSYRRARSRSETNTMVRRMNWSGLPTAS